MLRAIAILMILAVVLSGTAVAQDTMERGKKDAPEKKAPPTVMEKLLKELTALVAKEKAKPEYDAEIVKHLEALIKRFKQDAKKEKKKVALDDLSEADRKKLEAEVRQKMARERGAAGAAGRGGGGDWGQRALDSALEGVALKDEEKEKVTPILSDFQSEAWTAWRNGDNKLLKDLKNDTEKRLKKAVGSSKAKKIMNNVNRMFSRRRR